MEMPVVMHVRIVNTVHIVIKEEEVVVFALLALHQLQQKNLPQQIEQFQIPATLQVLNVKAQQKKD